MSAIEIRTRDEDGLTVYSFDARGHTFHVYQARGGWWTVYREPKGAQRNLFGKTFHSADEMVAAYKTAGATLRAIADLAAAAS